MPTKLGASLVAGMLAGVVFGRVLELVLVPTPGGGWTSMMAVLGQFVGTPTADAAWVCHLLFSGLAGAAFGWLLGPRVHAYGAALGWGTVYGIACWVVAALTVWRLLLRTAPGALLMLPGTRMVAIGSLIGHLMFGLTLGVAFVWLSRGIHEHAPVGT